MKSDATFKCLENSEEGTGGKEKKGKGEAFLPPVVFRGSKGANDAI